MDKYLWRRLFPGGFLLTAAVVNGSAPLEAPRRPSTGSSAIRPGWFRWTFLRRIGWLIGFGTLLLTAASESLQITNISQLYQTPSETAASGVPVSLTAVVTYADLSRNMVFLQDKTGGMYLTAAGITNEPSPGDFVELTGQAAVDDRITTLTRPTLRFLGRRPLPTPIVVTRLDVNRERLSAQWVQFTGRLRSFNPQQERFQLELLSGNTRLGCTVRHSLSNKVDLDSLLGRRLQIQGVWANHYQGNRVVGSTLFVPELACLIPLEPPAVTPAQFPVVPIGQVIAASAVGESAPRTRIQGVVIRKRAPGISQPGAAVIRDPTGSIQVFFVNEQQPITVDDRLDVYGFPTMWNQEVTLQDATYAVLPPQNPASLANAGDPRRSSAPTVLRRIQDVRALTKAEAAQALPVQLQGVITYATATDPYCFLQDDTGAIFVRVQQTELRPGHLAEVEGLTNPGGIARMIVEARVRILGVTNLPPPLKVELRDLISERYDCAWVELEGVVHSTEGVPISLLQLSTRQGDFEASLPLDHAVTASPSWIDSRIRLRGVSTPILDSRDQLLGLRLRVPSREFIDVLTPAPPDPFAVPARPIAAIRRGSPALLGLHRVSVRGRVTLVAIGQEFYLQDESGALRIVSIQTNTLSLGDSLEVSGFPRVDPHGIFLDGAVFRPARSVQRITPRLVRAEDVLPLGRYDQELVTMEGFLLNDAGGSTQPSLLVQSGAATFQAQFETGSKQLPAPVWRTGSRIRLTGLCAVQLSERDVPRAFLLKLRHPDDVLVLQGPPWWRPQYILPIGIIFLALALASVVWVVLLRREVRFQTAQVRQRIEAEMALQTRLALVWETSADGMRMTDAEGTMVQVNQAYCRMVQKDRQELIGQSMAIAYRAKDQPPILKAYQTRFVHQDISPRQEIQLVLWNGHRTWFEVTNTFFDQAGQPRLLLSQFRDVTARKRAEEALRESEERFRSTFEQAAVGVAHVAPDGRFLRVNEKLCRILDYSRDELLARTFQDITHPSDLEADLAEVRRMLDGTIQTYSIEKRYLRKDGAIVWVELTVSLLRDASREPKYFISVVEDISARKQAEKAVLESEERFRSLTNATLEGIMIHAQGVILDANPAFSRLFGFDSPEELMGRNGIEMLLTPESQARIRHRMQTGEQGPMEVTCIRKDGTTFVGETESRGLKYRGQDAKIVSCRDITERKRAEDALRLSQAQLMANLQNTPNVAVQWYDEEGRIFFWNPASEALYGWKSAEVLGKRLDALIHTPQEAAEFMRVLQGIRDTGQPFGPYEAHIHKRDGTPGWVLATTFGMPMGEGRMGFVCMDVDITNRKQAEAALRESEKRLNLALDAASASVWDVDLRTGRVTLDPKSMLRLGYALPEIPKTVEEWSALEHPEDRARVRSAFEAVIRGQTDTYRADHRIRRKDGRWIWIEARGCVFERGPNGRPLRIIGTSIDVTERKQSEEALREQQQMISAIVESSQDWIWAMDLRGRHTYSNRAVEKILGYSPAEFAGMGLDLVHPEDRQTVDGRWPAWIEARKGWQNIVLRWRTKTGNFRHLESTAVPILGTQGEVLGFRGVDRDITERKQAEDALQISLEEKIVLLKEVHHRVKNNLQIVCSLLSLQAVRTQNSEALATLQETGNRVRSMAILHETLYRSENLARVNFAGYIESICAQLFRSYGSKVSGIQLERHLADVSLELDPAVSCGLIVNELVSNSLKHAFPNGRAGRIVVETQALAEGRIGLTVADDGVGLPPLLDLRQTKTLGHQLVYMLAEKLDGTVEVNRDAGTRFRVEFQTEKREP